MHLCSGYLFYAALLTTTGAAALIPTTRQTGHSGSEILCTGSTETIDNLWSIDDMVATYSHDMSVAPGNASFTIGNTRTNYTERLSCSIYANSWCYFASTPGSKDLQVHLQIMLTTAYVTFSQPLACDDSG